MVKSHKRRHNAETFKVKEHVLVRYKPQRGCKLPPKRRFVVKGKIVKKSKKNPDSYKVKFMPPNCSEHKEKWFSVEDMASIRKRHSGSKSKEKQKVKELRKRLYIPLTACNRFLDRDFPDMDLSLMYNPPGDGNCQFGALCFWLSLLGIHRSAETVRERFVSPSLWFGAKNGLPTFVNSLVDHGRQVGKCLCNLQQNMLLLIKSNSTCLS